MRRNSKLPLLINVPLKVEPTPLEDQTPEAIWVTVTPELAAKWLEETNTNNRTVREEYAMRLSNDMREGRWRGKNGEAVRFDTNGRLVDGQHRLWACVMAEVPFDTLLVRGVDAVDYSTIGIGRAKNLADFLGPVNGEKNTALLSAVLRLVYLWRNNDLINLKNGLKTATVTECQCILADNPCVRESVTFISNHPAIRRMLTPSFSALIHYSAITQGKQACVEAFLQRLGDGLGMTQEDPVWQLRRFLLAQKGPQPGRKRSSQLYVLALATKAWNAVKEGRSMKALHFKMDEKFPTL